MTPNEKKALIKFKEIKEGNTVSIAGRLRVTINYAGEVCGKLCKKGYLERLLPGMFAKYRITSLGEEQVEGEGNVEKELAEAVGVVEESKKATEQSEGVPPSESENAKVEETDEYECMSCGAVIKEDDTECPKCGVVFEDVVEEEV